MIRCAISFFFQLSVLIVGIIFFYGGIKAGKYHESMFEDPNTWYIVDGIAVILWCLMFTGKITPITPFGNPNNDHLIIGSFLFTIPYLVFCIILTSIFGAGFLGIYMYKTNFYVGIIIIIDFIYMLINQEYILD